MKNKLLFDDRQAKLLLSAMARNTTNRPISNNQLRLLGNHAFLRQSLH